MKVIQQQYNLYLIFFCILLPMGLMGCGGGAGTNPIITPNPNSTPTPLVNATPAPNATPRPTTRAVSITVQAQASTNITTLASDYGVIVKDSLPAKNLYTLEVPAGKSETEIEARLKTDSRLLFTESEDEVNVAENGSVKGSPVHVPFDFITTPDVNYDAISNGGSVNQNAYAQVNLGKTHETTLGAGMVVAVLDTGVLATHPNLKNHLLVGYDAIEENTPPDEEVGATSGVAWGHGTMVTGVITRLAPEAKVLPVRVLDANGGGSLLCVVRGIRWAVAHGAKVINMSFGTPTHSDILEDAISEAHAAGVMLIGAGGNAGTETRHFPASYGDVFCVGALENDNTKAPYSNFGLQISLCAPGTGIRSTFADGGYAAWDGTSFATPFVSAAATLVWSANPTFGTDTVTDRLMETAHSLNNQNPAYANKLGRGVLDIEKAVLVGGG
jgi:subtilisin family serine protease